MELFLFLAAFYAFFLLPAGAPVMLRCGLAACLRFSPRAALALSSCASLAGCTSMLLCRGGLCAVPAQQRIPIASAAFIGGTLGRMLLLMFIARFSGSLELARIQVLPLLLFVIAAGFPMRMHLPSSWLRLFVFSLLCAACEGFWGCGGAVFFFFVSREDICRRRFSPPGSALLLCMIAQFSALLLTHFSGAAEIFPAHIPLSLAAASALGGAVFEKTKRRSPAKTGLRIALYIYMLLAALAGIEQTFL